MKIPMATTTKFDILNKKGSLMQESNQDKESS